MLDEPNSNLDEAGEAALVTAVKDLRQQAKTVFLITHRTNIIGVADRLLVLHDGAMLRYGPTREVIASLQPPRAATPSPGAAGAGVPPAPQPI